MAHQALSSPFHGNDGEKPTEREAEEREVEETGGAGRNIHLQGVFQTQSLWQLLCVNHTASAHSVKSVPVSSANKRQCTEVIEQRVAARLE
ncbi:hypothetical protein K1719_035331 [Acacia pycnantha]|nr:hypothetical protein K1719_035331 [Acacia pycnantha]